MKLKVEIEWQLEPWKRRFEVKLLSIVDASFGVIVAILYICKLSFDLEPEFPVIKPSDRWNHSLALVFLVAANLLQTVHASGLCYIITRNGANPVTCHKTARVWFDFTEFSYLFIVVKCVISMSYIVKVYPHPWLVILTAITLPECIFKLYMLYVVHCFMLDLRESVKYMPKFNFIPIQSSSPDIFAQQQNETDFKMEPDVNANTQLIA